MADTEKKPAPQKEFFISYNSADSSKAEWVAWILEEAGYSTIIQAWDFKAGVQFPVMMQKAAIEADRMIACLSNAYLDALFTQPEWAAFFVKDPTGKEGKLLPVRIEDFDPPGMFQSMVYIEAEAICLELGNKEGLQRTYGNQALILQAWGSLEEAMELLKKMESICREVGLKPYLKKCYNIQIQVLEKLNKQTGADAIREKLEELNDIVSA